MRLTATECHCVRHLGLSGSLDNVPSVVDTLINAVRSGELDSREQAGLGTKEESSLIRLTRKWAWLSASLNDPGALSPGLGALRGQQEREVLRKAVKKRSDTRRLGPAISTVRMPFGSITEARFHISPAGSSPSPSVQDADTRAVLNTFTHLLKDRGSFLLTGQGPCCLPFVNYPLPIRTIACKKLSGDIGGGFHDRDYENA
jgi:hypothetical protein